MSDWTMALSPLTGSQFKQAIQKRMFYLNHKALVFNGGINRVKFSGSDDIKCQMRWSNLTLNSMTL